MCVIRLCWGSLDECSGEKVGARAPGEKIERTPRNRGSLRRTAHPGFVLALLFHNRGFVPNCRKSNCLYCEIAPSGPLALAAFSKSAHCFAKSTSKNPVHLGQRAR
jgi:hypothetical protein